MLRFLSSLFSPTAPEADSLDPALIEAAIERAVDGTDRRLRALSGYRKQLRAPVERAVSHVIALVDQLPAPTEISRRSFGADTRVRAFFSSSEHLQEVLRRFQGIRDCLAQGVDPRPECVYGLLMMHMEERSVLGMALEGEAVRRDVLQTSVSFSDHRYLCPAAHETDSRWELKKRAFDFLIEKALEQLVEKKHQRVELERQRSLLRRKLAAMRAGNWGLGDWQASGEAPPTDLATLEAEIEAIDAELKQFGSQALGLEESLECVAEVLGQPADGLASRELGLQLDYRGIKLEGNATAPSRELRLVELFSGEGTRRIALLGRVPRDEMPERPDFLKEASRYLS